MSRSQAWSLGHQLKTPPRTYMWVSSLDFCIPMSRIVGRLLICSLSTASCISLTTWELVIEPLIRAYHRQALYNAFCTIDNLFHFPFLRAHRWIRRSESKSRHVLINRANTLHRICMAFIKRNLHPSTGWISGQKAMCHMYIYRSVYPG